MQLEPSRNTRWKSRGNHESVGLSKMSIKSIVALRRKFPSEIGKHQLEKSKVQRQICISERNPNTWENGRCPHAPPDQESTEWNEEQEE